MLFNRIDEPLYSDIDFCLSFCSKDGYFLFDFNILNGLFSKIISERHTFYKGKCKHRPLMFYQAVKQISTFDLFWLASYFYFTKRLFFVSLLTYNPVFCLPHGYFYNICDTCSAFVCCHIKCHQKLVHSYRPDTTLLF